MVQFKDVFKGIETRPYTRSALSQKCLRVSGKQNDLEEVGRTTRHHTFFEMLGNFSFGDYFRAEAIEFAWEFLTHDLALPKERLWITVFGGEGDLPADEDARQLWRKTTGFSDERIVGLGLKDNFWAMGDTGPCGVTSEIFVDMGSGPVSLADFESGRLVEIWNLVFLQFDRQSDGKLMSLPKPCIDTGMGIERLACVVQGETSNFHTDLFAPLIARTSELVGKSYSRSDSEDDVSMRVIADHARAVAFLVAEGIHPSNEGRGYVMRRIMRRAIRHGQRLGFDEPFLHEICAIVVQTMGDAYPELREASVLMSKVAELEETAFRRTLEKGLVLLQEEIAKTKTGGVLSGSSVFKLYDTFGFPPDLTRVIASERGIGIDDDGFAREMVAQQERSRGSAVGEAAIAPVYKQLRDRLGPVRFVGYPDEKEPLSAREGKWRVESTDAGRYLETAVEVSAVIQDGVEVQGASDGLVEVVLTPMPFYGESGGQVGDRGLVVAEGGLTLKIVDTKKPLDDFAVAHARIIRGEVQPGTKVWAGYDPDVRQLTRAHHSATHLLHASLRKVLGEHVKQAGSLVDPEHLRFDYTHFEAPTAEQLRAIEDDANARVRQSSAVTTEVMPLERAKEKGAVALFGEKYGETVRVVTMGDSIEFCGGTHVSNTADIGLILVTREESVASGTRRLEAEVGAAAERTLTKILARLGRAAAVISGEENAADELGGRKAVGELAEPLVSSIAATVRDAQAKARELAEAGEVSAPLKLSVVAPKAPAEWTLPEARRIRDLWRGLVRLSHVHGAEASVIAQDLRFIDTEGLLAAYAHLVAIQRDLEKKLDRVRASRLSSSAGDLLRNVRDVGGVKLLTARVAGLDSKSLRELNDQVRSKAPSGVVCLCSDAGGRALLLVSVSADLVPRLSAIELVNKFAHIIGGRGGGKRELAQAGGSNTSAQATDELFAALALYLEQQRI
jgi:alanyl-tRNA synthetase